MKLIRNKYIDLDILEKQKYIKIIKDNFELNLAKKLDLIRVSAPIIIDPKSGLQDDLSGVERKVSFDIKEDENTLEIVQSLAKWKRYALGKYRIDVNKGIYTDMMAIRRDDVMDNIHSIYVDQWDWEKVISINNRNMSYLKETVQKIVDAIVDTSELLKTYEFNKVSLNRNVHFIDSQELLDLYPNLSAKEREYEIVKKYKTVFITKIGDILSNNTPHDLRAPDYDDWNLNGDLLFYHEVLDIALEISSMGIRVDSNSMKEQLKKSNKNERLKLDYHRKIINNDLPLSIGGGIGQSRLCMLLLGRAHIGEVQSSYWNKDNLDYCEQNNIEIL